MDHADAQTLAKPPFMRICREFEIGAIYALYPECFCDKNLAIRKVFAFCDSVSKENAFSMFLIIICQGGGLDSRKQESAFDCI